jgi:hypothetical protein
MQFGNFMSHRYRADQGNVVRLIFPAGKKRGRIAAPVSTAVTYVLSSFAFAAGCFYPDLPWPLLTHLYPGDSREEPHLGNSSQEDR